MKYAEARILVFLSQVPAQRRNIKEIAAKLGISYNYAVQTIGIMEIKGFVRKTRLGKAYHFSNLYEPNLKKIREAKKMLAKEGFKKQ